MIDEKDEQVGVIDTQKALDIARERGFDLVEVVPNAQPPVCKLLNFGKFLYRMAKQERQHKAKQKKSEMKSIRISINTGKNDLEVKAKKIAEFLDQGHQIKTEIILNGREKQHRELARKKLQDFISTIPVAIGVVQAIKSTPRGFFIVINKI